MYSGLAKYKLHELFRIPLVFFFFLHFRYAKRKLCHLVDLQYNFFYMPFLDNSKVYNHMCYHVPSTCTQLFLIQLAKALNHYACLPDNFGTLVLTQLFCKLYPNNSFLSSTAYHHGLSHSFTKTYAFILPRPTLLIVV